MTPRWYWRNRIRCRNSKMDRTNLNIWKRKNIPATTEIINRNKQRNRGQFIRSLPMIKKKYYKNFIGFSLFCMHRKHCKSIILH